MQMTVAAPSSNLGRHLFGAAALASGIITLVWHDYHDFDQLRYILNPADGPVFVYAAGAAQIFGGAAIQFRRTAKTGVVVLGAVYLLFALLCVPRILTSPQIYDRWGNFFEPFSLVIPEQRSFTRACHRHGHRKRAIGSGAFSWGSVPLRSPSSRHFILTTRLVLFRSGFRQVRCFGR